MYAVVDGGFFIYSLAYLLFIYLFIGLFIYLFTLQLEIFLKLKSF